MTSLVTHYNIHLVILSIAIACLASYTTLDLVGRVTATRNRTQMAWLLGGAIAMGVGIWSMHFIGMLAFHLPLTVSYNIGAVCRSIVPAVIASGIALFLVSRATVRPFHLLAASLLLGIGIASMHYLGMASMQMQATVHYNMAIVACSILIAIAVSFAGLSLAVQLRDETRRSALWKKYLAASLMGAAIPTMHYTGIAAAQFTQANQEFNITTLQPAENAFILSIAVTIGSSVLLGLTVLTAVFDRRLCAQAMCNQAIQSSQHHLQTILQGVQVGVAVVEDESDIQLSNQAILDLLGLSTVIDLQTVWTTALTADDDMSLPTPGGKSGDSESRNSESRNSESGDSESRNGSDQNSPNFNSLHLVRSLQPVVQKIAIREVVHNAIISLSPDELEQTVESESGVEGLYPTPPRTLLVNAVPLHLPDSTQPQMICTFSNITELKQTEQRLQESELQARQQAEARQQALRELQHMQVHLIQSEKMSGLGQLVAGVAHEINNPVNFIHGNLSHVETYAEELLGLVQLYQEHYPNVVPDIQAETEAIDLMFLQEDLPRTLASMKVGTNRIRQIISSLRTFSRMDEAIFKTANIHEGIESTLMILQHRLKAKQKSPIEVIRDYAELPKIECAPGQLNQVLMNILANAIDALDSTIPESSHPKQIRIKTTLIPAVATPKRVRTDQGNDGVGINPDPGIANNQAAIRIAIADNGPGIPQEVQHHIFEPFFTTKPVGKGTGLGMSISYQIITEIHNGSITCVSMPGQGTEFIIQLPMQQSTQPLSERTLQLSAHVPATRSH